MNIKRLTIDSICLALLVVSTYISIPITEIAFTLQVLVVLLLAFALPISDAILINVIYLLMGLIGLPVFALFGGGIISFLRPSFGFILGFILVPVIIKVTNKIKTKKIITKYLIGGCCSIVVLYLVGTIYFYLLQSIYFGNSELKITSVLSICVIPFIPFDIIKIIISSYLTLKLKSIIKVEGLYENY